MYKTFDELERLAYMSNLPKIASLYAQLDDNEKAEDEIKRLHAKIHDLEWDSDYHQCNSEALEKKVEALENKLRKIEDIING
jgi:SMC interacting uncharacterized protein involved in chromosome segregation